MKNIGLSFSNINITQLITKPRWTNFSPHEIKVKKKIGSLEEKQETRSSITRDPTFLIDWEGLFDRTTLRTFYLHGSRKKAIRSGIYLNLKLDFGENYLDIIFFNIICNLMLMVCKDNDGTTLKRDLQNGCPGWYDIFVWNCL